MPLVLQTSKYRNAVPKAAKKEDSYAEIQSVGLCSSDASDSIDCSLKWLAVRNSGAGNVVQLFDINKTGRSPQVQVQVNVGSTVSDFKFSPFDSNVLVTGGEDSAVKIWRVADKKAEVVVNVTVGQKRIEAVRFNPSCQGVYAAACNSEVVVYDGESKLQSFSHADAVHSIGWKSNGQLLATTSKDCLLRVFDARLQGEAQSTTSHQGSKLKSSRVAFLGNKILTTGFGAQRQREYALFDQRNMAEPLTRQSIAGSSGTSLLLPLFDEDMNILYLVGKGETTLRWMELQSSGNSQFTDLQQFIAPNPLSAATLMKKSSLNVMDGEINRLLYVAPESTGSGSIVPVVFTVPRKSYRDFSHDLFGCGTSGEQPFFYSKDEWLQCKYENDTDGVVKRASLEPKVEQPTVVQTIRKPSVASADVKDSLQVKPSAESKSPSRRSSATVPAALQNMRTSSFRYISGKPLHASTHFEDIRNINYGLSGESNVLESNKKFLAFPLAGSGGRVGILRTDKPERVQSVMHSVLGGCDIFDFALSRHVEDLLVTGCDDGKLRVWKLPDEGVYKEDLTKTAADIQAHNNRINMVQFHPYVKNLLLSSSIEQMGVPGSGQNPTVKLWDLEKMQLGRTLEGFEDLPLSISVGYDGLIAVSGKDKQARVFDARQSKQTMSFTTHEGIRASRLAWVDDQHILSVGFGKGSQRELLLFNIKNTQQPVGVLPLDVSPAILVPFFDADTSLVYLCGRGDTGITPVEVTPSHATQPLFALPRYDSPGATIQQGVSFVGKKHLDTRNIEIARCWRLTQNSIEPINFSIPRNRKEFFQDDIFPLTWDDEVPSLQAGDWLNGAKDVQPKRDVNLCPSGMVKLSEAPAENKRASKYTFDAGPRPLTDSQKQQKFLDNLYMSAKSDEGEKAPLAQDLMEGVSEDEWKDY